MPHTLKIFGLLSVLLFLSPVEAQSVSAEEQQMQTDRLHKLEVRVNPFFPTGKRMRKIYGYVWPNYGIEASRKVNSFIDGWSKIDYANSHGHVYACHVPSKIQILNGSFGLKLTSFRSPSIQIYLGIGPTLGGVWVRNHSSCTNEHVKKFFFGGVLKVGFIAYLPSHLILNFFGDYSYEPAWFDKAVNLGGAKAGLGLGYNF